MTWRTELLSRLPWITRLPEGRPCDQYRWGDMPHKAVHKPELKETYRCGRTAVWQFTGLTPRTDDRLGQDIGRSGTYCYAHLVNEAFIPWREEERYRRWARRNGDLIDRIKSGIEPKLIKRVRKSAPHDVSDEA